MAVALADALEDVEEDTMVELKVVLLGGSGLEGADDASLVTNWDENVGDRIPDCAVDSDDDPDELIPVRTGELNGASVMLEFCEEEVLEAISD